MHKKSLRKLLLIILSITCLIAFHFQTGTYAMGIDDNEENLFAVVTKLDNKRKDAAYAKNGRQFLPHTHWCCFTCGCIVCNVEKDRQNEIKRLEAKLRQLQSKETKPAPQANL